MDVTTALETTSMIGKELRTVEHKLITSIRVGRYNSQLRWPSLTPYTPGCLRGALVGLTILPNLVIDV